MGVLRTALFREVWCRPGPALPSLPESSAGAAGVVLPPESSVCQPVPSVDHRGARARVGGLPQELTFRVRGMVSEHVGGMGRERERRRGRERGGPRRGTVGSTGRARPALPCPSLAATDLEAWSLTPGARD